MNMLWFLDVINRKRVLKFRRPEVMPGSTVVSSDVTEGTGSALNFGHQEVTGVYRVKAIADNGCTATMRDSVIVYPPLPVFEAEVKGSFCNGDTTGVSLLLKRTAKGWKYYVTNGYLRSDTLQRIDGGGLAWNKLYNGSNAVSVLNGVYYFHANRVAECDGR